MKLNTVFIAAALCIFVASCSKNANEPQLQHPPIHPASNPNLLQGEDESHPIVMIATQDVNGLPIIGAGIMFTKGIDTALGLTNTSGQCLITLPSPGEWNLNIAKAGYATINTQVTMADSFSTIRDTLHT
jgi:hypothetical protein